LFAANAEGYGKPCTDVPRRVCHKFCRVDVDGAEDAVEVAYERDAAGGESTAVRKDGAAARSRLPSSFHVEGGQAADVAIGAGHFVKQAVAHGAARASTNSTLRPAISMQLWLSG